MLVGLALFVLDCSLCAHYGLRQITHVFIVSMGVVGPPGGILRHRAETGQTDIG